MRKFIVCLAAVVLFESGAASSVEAGLFHCRWCRYGMNGAAGAPGAPGAPAAPAAPAQYTIQFQMPQEAPQAPQAPQQAPLGGFGAAIGQELINALIRGVACGICNSQGGQGGNIFGGGNGGNGVTTTDISRADFETKRRVLIELLGIPAATVDARMSQAIIDSMKDFTLPAEAPQEPAVAPVADQPAEDATASLLTELKAMRAEQQQQSSAMLKLLGEIKENMKPKEAQGNAPKN